MADETRTATSAIELALAKDPTKFGFFHVMRLLENAYKDKARFGESQRPSDEPPIRFGQEISLTFESSTLSSFAQRKNGLMPVLK